MKAIYKQNRKRHGRSKYLLHAEAAVVNSEEFPSHAPCLCSQSKQLEGLAGICGNGYKPHSEEVVRIYDKHWGIEAFFKVCKSFSTWRRTAALFRMTR